MVLTHKDFRTGNYIVDGAGHGAILDWEFAAWGDPMADLGWFCAKLNHEAHEEREGQGEESHGGTLLDATQTCGSRTRGSRVRGRAISE